MKYGQVTTVLVNAIQQQQRLIEKQQNQINALQADNNAALSLRMRFLEKILRKKRVWE